MVFVFCFLTSFSMISSRGIFKCISLICYISTVIGDQFLETHWRLPEPWWSLPTQVPLVLSHVSTWPLIPDRRKLHLRKGLDFLYIKKISGCRRLSPALCFWAYVILRILEANRWCHHLFELTVFLIKSYMNSRVLNWELVPALSSKQCRWD